MKKKNMKLRIRKKKSSDNKLKKKIERPKSK
jgi:hypothetical protein